MPSSAVTVSSIGPTKPRGGVPVNVWVSGLNVSQYGSGSPLPSVALNVSGSLSGSSSEPAGTWKVQKALAGELWSRIGIATSGALFSSSTAPMSTVPFSTRVNVARIDRQRFREIVVAVEVLPSSEGSAVLSPALCATPPARIRMVSTGPPLSASAPAWNSSPLAGVPSGSIVVSVAKMFARSALDDVVAVAGAGLREHVDAGIGRGAVNGDIRHDAVGAVAGDDAVGQRGGHVVGSDAAAIIRSKVARQRAAGHAQRTA